MCVIAQDRTMPAHAPPDVREGVVLMGGLRPTPRPRRSAPQRTVTRFRPSETSVDGGPRRGFQ